MQTDRTTKAFVAKHPGEKPVRCKQCGRILATVTDFSGLIDLRCHSCKQYRQWDGEGVASTGRSNKALRPRRCWACDSTLFQASVHFQGTVYVRCRSCRAENAATGIGIQKRMMSEMDQDEFVALMEERWLAFVKSQSRKRADVAVGMRFDVFTRDGFRCRYCGRSADDGAILHADHVLPQSKGGPATLDNLVTACFECNIGKSAKILPDSLHPPLLVTRGDPIE